MGPTTSPAPQSMASANISPSTSRIRTTRRCDIVLQSPPRVRRLVTMKGEGDHKNEQNNEQCARHRRTTGCPDAGQRRSLSAEPDTGSHCRTEWRHDDAADPGQSERRRAADGLYAGTRRGRSIRHAQETVGFDGPDTGPPGSGPRNYQRTGSIGGGYREVQSVGSEGRYGCASRFATHRAGGRGEQTADPAVAAGDSGPTGGASQGPAAGGRTTSRAGGAASGGNGGTKENRRQQGCHRGGQQALRRTGRLQHFGRDNRLFRQRPSDH